MLQISIKLKKTKDKKVTLFNKILTKLKLVLLLLATLGFWNG